ncbi:MULTISPECIES: hypothetical protein [unclassified Breznakia]|uniref:hypothetical protein n=1 Tax=unclassified Breznakia TaxID=2623764 RepID=UPI002473D078|nr:MULTISPECIES: hypothetical protein [unclassified Breznakia]MDH6367043.1 putative membrane protein [Breznakia sp. PH1-1]MDH6404185.1 putative membrane protein [Breznakia sp. PF1-11]MDH6411930.1 putative membrane protein [Breznakia sp. PFB1-11]MDH6414173.1 putative membrane protein [Breznakia sp. PFB1-14]MDH6418926.1 putative membrane protein [Breznakia sp. PFB1-12]
MKKMIAGYIQLISLVVIAVLMGLNKSQFIDIGSMLLILGCFLFSILFELTKLNETLNKIHSEQIINRVWGKEK